MVINRATSHDPERSYVILTVIFVCTDRVTPASAPTGAALAIPINVHHILYV